ncbi:FAD-dependent oxidoreductase [Pseudomonas mosselii]|uniref:FAD-dependent oxidoreductase n=1 Tax=Pseudomonas mosselii TaxID=78327 RepID=UPI001646F40F|nr:FAD-dependent oxidoreductase [Pseudomonas mosselii]MBC3451319.1 FAD-dependent oxidoreductase [Pseudomonas mosselii]MEB5934051.1 FAD-binding oxidoreductase [Pseudomonas mosselii]
MSPTHEKQTAVIIGGGFYGAAIAIYLAKQRGLRHVLLIEQEAALLARASYHNQARVHNGYHYPRSFTTAYRSRINLPRFVKDWPDAVRQDFTKLYAIARRNSKVTARQFERFCRDIGARIEPATAELQGLFEPRLVEKVFLVDEYAFDSTKLATWAADELEQGGTQVRYETKALEISRAPDNLLSVVTEAKDGTRNQIACRYVFNCTYSGLNHFKGDFPGVQARLKQEITEMPLMRMPAPLAGLGITVMDGPFFSMMPFPARGLHTLSHVRYTPHLHWEDQPDINPYDKLGDYEQKSRVDRMLRDVGRYLPCILNAEHADSLFEVKTVLTKSEGDDGRPILFERHVTLPGCYSILGGKIDNIYDALEKLDSEPFSEFEFTP